LELRLPDPTEVLARDSVARINPVPPGHVRHIEAPALRHFFRRQSSVLVLVEAIEDLVGGKSTSSAPLRPRSLHDEQAAG
jgi:hypothetical protein